MVNITYATQNQGKCDTAVTRPSECYNAAVKLDPSMANAKFLVLDSKQFPEGCSMIHYNNGTADVVLNKRTESVEACGAGAQQWLGKWKNVKKTPSKVAHNCRKMFFFNTANWPKTSPNLKFCSIKIAHRTTYI